MSSSSFCRAGGAVLRRHALVALVPFAPLLVPSAALAQGTPSASLAQDGNSAALETVVVTANRTPQPLSSVLADISVIDREEIERSGALDLASLLARLPGVEFARSGGPGTATSVFIRGAESRHTAVYLDGVRLDSQSTGGAVWEQIALEQIDRIEVLRGPAAAVYGSDAVSGVVQLFTKRGQGAARPTASVTVGSHNTRQVQAGISGSGSAFDYSVSASHGRSDGFNSRTAPTANPDKDGWRRDAGHARLGLQLNPEHRIEASLQASNLRSQYDGFTPGLDDVNYHTLRTGSLSWEGRWTDDATTRLQLGQTDSTYETRPSYYRTETRLRNYTLQHEQWMGGSLLTATLERREDELLNPGVGATDTLEGTRHQDAVGLGWRSDFGAHGIQLHLRHDEDSEFGGESTGSLAWGWAFLPQWRVTAGTATSFRVPTLYQRFSQYGNPALEPETGRNLEVGLRWAAAGSQVSLSVWRNKVTNLINFGSPGPCSDPYGCYGNIGRAELEGITLAGSTEWAGVTLRGSLDWHDPRNLDTGKVLPRRAKKMASFGAETQMAGWTFGAEVQASGERFEDADNTQRMGGYGLLNLFVSKTLRPGLTLEGRIDNVGDKAYEVARTYATPGRFGQLALRWTLP
jgi:vitamin B12 transporter